MLLQADALAAGLDDFFRRHVRSASAASPNFNIVSPSRHALLASRLCSWLAMQCCPSVSAIP